MYLKKKTINFLFITFLTKKIGNYQVFDRQITKLEFTSIKQWPALQITLEMKWEFHMEVTHSLIELRYWRIQKLFIMLGNVSRAISCSSFEKMKITQNTRPCTVSNWKIVSTMMTAVFLNFAPHTYNHAFK